MSDTKLHDFCKGFGALLSRSKVRIVMTKQSTNIETCCVGTGDTIILLPIFHVTNQSFFFLSHYLKLQQASFPEEASRLNDRGNLPLHAACSFQATADVVEVLLRAYPGGASQPNGVGNLPIHQAAMWQAPVETVEVLLVRHPEGTTVRNQYGSLPLHMAASNRASPEVVKLLIDAYPDALHLQNDDGMTPLDLAMADEAMVNDQVVAMLEGRPAPPEMTRRQKADKYNEQADMLERKMVGMRNTKSGPSAATNNSMKLALAAVRKLADRFPHALYAAGMDPNELEIAFSDQLENKDKALDAEAILLDAVRKRVKPIRDARGITVSALAPRDRVEELLSSIIALDHIKSQVRYNSCNWLFCCD